MSGRTFHVRPPGQEGTAGAPLPALFLSGPRQPHPSQCGLERQRTLYWLRSKNSVHGPPIIKSHVPCALAEFCSKECVVRSFVLESCRGTGQSCLRGWPPASPGSAHEATWPGEGARMAFSGRAWNPRSSQGQLLDLAQSGPQRLTCRMETTVVPAPRGLVRMK